MILAIILLLIVIAIVVWPRRRGRGRCPECQLGTLHKRKKVKLPATPGFTHRMTLGCDMCGATVINGSYQPKPVWNPHGVAILEGRTPPPPRPPADEDPGRVVKGG